jgi:hypothetical protein
VLANAENRGSNQRQRATEVRLLAERQMGEFLKAMPKNAGGDPVPYKNRVSEPASFAKIGITKSKAMSPQSSPTSPPKSLPNALP